MIKARLVSSHWEEKTESYMHIRMHSSAPSSLPDESEII